MRAEEEALWGKKGARQMGQAVERQIGTKDKLDLVAHIFNRSPLYLGAGRSEALLPELMASLSYITPQNHKQKNIT